MIITAEHVARFEQEGYLAFERILTPEQVASTSAAMQRVYAGEYRDERRPPALRKPVAPLGGSQTVHWILNARVLDAELWALATSPVLGEVAARLLRTESVSILEDQLLDKPGPSVPVNVHQDYSYWSFSRSTALITCWIALVDVTLDLGPVEVIPGSHKWKQAPRPRELVHGSEQDWDAVVTSVRPEGAEVSFVPVIVPAGGGVFFHGLTFHGSRANKSTNVRRACSLHWAAEECRVDRSRLHDYDHPYFFAGIQDGARLVNKYFPVVYPAPQAG